MKYIIMLGDGMADYPVPELGGVTPLQAAKKPNIDALAPHAVLGMVKTVPDRMIPGSDVANLAAMGYDPAGCYTGRSPLEAVSIGIKMEDTDMAFRCNSLTLSEDEPFEEKTMVDYSADEITTEESSELIRAVGRELGTKDLVFYPGFSYRHCLIWHNGPAGIALTPPHEISDRKITDYLPKDPTILGLMKKSYEILKDHPLNIARKKRGLHPANACWFWGEGTKPKVANFQEMYGVKASVISAVDLIKGIGISAGMKVIEVEGATGNLDSNFAGKGQAAIDTLLKDGQDLVYIHCEAPDECGHHGDAKGKVKSIELIDEKIVGPVVSAMRNAGEAFTMLVMPDHPTPVSVKTHVSDPIPFLMYRSDREVPSGRNTYTEESCSASGLYVDHGYTLMKHMLDGCSF